MKKNYNYNAEMKIGNPNDPQHQMSVVVFPKKKPKNIPKYDNIYLSLESLHADQKNLVHGVYMTPDEALSIANMLTTAGISRTIKTSTPQEKKWIKRIKRRFSF